jgi:hypothetical protein
MPTGLLHGGLNQPDPLAREVGPRVTNSEVTFQAASLSLARSSSCSSRLRGALKSAKEGCAHCAHPGLRIVSYRARFRPDW